MGIRVEDNGTVRGMAALRKKLDRQIIAGLTMAALEVQGYAKTHHKFKAHSPSSLENAIDHEVNEVEGYAEVFINEDVAPYGKYVHEATGKFGPKKKADDIFPKKGKMLRFAPSAGTAPWRLPPYGRFFKGGWCYAYGVTHPGSPADPFLYEALEQKKDDVLEIFNRHVKKVLERSK